MRLILTLVIACCFQVGCLHGGDSSRTKPVTPQASGGSPERPPVTFRLTEDADAFSYDGADWQPAGVVRSGTSVAAVGFIGEYVMLLVPGEGLIAVHGSKLESLWAAKT